MVEFDCNNPGYSQNHTTTNYDKVQDKGQLESSDKDGSTHRVFFFTGNNEKKIPKGFRDQVDTKFIEACNQLAQGMEYDRDRGYEEDGGGSGGHKGGNGGSGSGG